MARNTNTAKKVEAQAPANTEVVASSAPTAPAEAKQSMAEKIAAVNLDGMTTKSAKIRALSAAGIPNADIARHLQIKYQHVRNVLVQPAPQVKNTEESASTDS